MNRKNSILLVVALVWVGAALLSAGCDALRRHQAANPRQPKDVRLEEKLGACGSGVGLSVGDTLELALESDLTGYVWEIGFNVPAVLKVTGQPSYEPGSNVGAASRTSTFRLTAVAEGQETLRLIYHRPTEQGAPVSRICDVQVTVTA